MNNINFINPVPPSRNKEVRLWTWITVCVLIASIIGISITTGIQGYLYYSLRQKRQQLEQQLQPLSSVIEQEVKQREEQKQLQKSLDKITAYATKPKNPIDLILALHQTTGAMAIQSLSVSPDAFELQTVCPNAQEANACLQKLTKNNYIYAVKLTSLQVNQKQLLATFKGSVRKR